jgi:oligoribonuclease NrnB/cAMP/cGMP phosphodiesterase (DHH superfamily)
MTAAWAYWSSNALSEEERKLLAHYGGKYADGGESGSETTGSPTSIEGALRILNRGLPTAFVFVHPTAVLPEELVRGRHVILLDIHLEKCLESIIEKAESVFVGDHHRSGEALIVGCASKHPGRFQCVYDVTRSGARIAWDHFHAGEAVPPLVAYVEDRDLWAWRLPRSREINEAIYVGNFMETFAALDSFHLRWTKTESPTSASLAEDGARYLEYQRAIVDGLARRASPMTMNSGGTDYRVLVVNAGTLASEVGNHILANYTASYESCWPVDFVALWSYSPSDNRIYVSCRASRAGIDLSVIAANPTGGVQGGGHARAAGFSVIGPDITKVFKPVSPCTDPLRSAMASLAIGD